MTVVVRINSQLPCVRDRDVHNQYYQTEFFFLLFFALSEPLMLRILKKN